MNLNRKMAGKIILPLAIALLTGLAGGVLISKYTTFGQNIIKPTAGNQSTEKEILYWVAPMDPDYRRDEPGKSPMGMDLVPVYAEEEKEPEILYWVAPMDPAFRRDKPGKSPMGMDLVPVYAEEGADSDAVHISAAVEQSLGVRTSKAERRSLWRKVEATGYVGFDETRVSQINLRTEGWIERLLVKNEGERVKKGQLLFEFYSPQVVNAQKEYVQAKRRNDARMSGAAEEKLLALGMVQDDIRRLAKTSKVTNTVQVLAPQDGTVTSLNVKEGIFVKPATEIMSLADLSSVWLQAEVFESQADWVMESQSAEARFNYLPGEVFSGRVDYVYPVLDPKTRTLQVRLRFDNPDERMKPNMYARVTIFGKSHPGALSIPREALIRGQDIDRVVVALGNGKFTVHEVVSGIESGSWVEIVAGLQVGDEVVTSAQFLIDSEASLAGSIQRLDSQLSDDGLADNQTVYGSGVVEAVDPTARRVRITHGPIETLGWAAMTMEFDVLPGASLESIQVGQSVHFALGQSDVGDYVISIIHKPETSGTDSDEGHGIHQEESSS
ncbi:MAG: efflux RND transporter periplasmic adaptor subunit [Xanthomonadales bacterium]|nr:efflux RND transporter periplasmic adaptor subunit [Xanthomonadales bacterium]